MGRLGFLFVVENDDVSKEFVVVFVDVEKLCDEVVVGVDYLKISDAKFFILNEFNDLREFLVFDKNKIKFGKISVAKDKIVSFEDFVFWLPAGDTKRMIDNELEMNYKSVRELMTVSNVNDKVALEQELSMRSTRLFKMFSRYVK